MRREGEKGGRDFGYIPAGLTNQARRIIDSPWPLATSLTTSRLPTEALRSNSPSPSHTPKHAAATIDPVAEEACATRGLQWQPGLYCLGRPPSRGGAHHRFVPFPRYLLGCVLTSFVDGKKVSIEGTMPVALYCGSSLDPDTPRSRHRPNPSLRESRKRRPAILLP